jgi:hypothetical protein
MTKVVKKSGMEIKKFMLETLGKNFGGAMIRQSKTWRGMMSNLADSWTMFQKEIGDGGFFENIKGRLANLLDYLGRLKADGTLGRWAKNISDAMTGSLDFAINTVERLGKHISFLGQWISANPETFKAIAYGLGLIAAVKFPWIAALLALDDILSWMRGAPSVIGDFAKSLEELTGIDAGAIGTVLAALSAGAAAFLLFGGSFKIVATGLRALAASLVFLAGSNVAGGLGVISKLITLLGRLSPYMAMFGLLSGGVPSKDTPNGKQTPEQAKAHLDDQLKKARQGELPSQYSERRKKMEDWLRPPARGTVDDNTPMNARDVADRFARWGSNLENARMNAMRAGGGMSGGNTTVNAPTTVVVNMPVQQVMDAAVAAGKKVTDVVGSKLNSLPSHPTRTTPSPTF